MQRKEDIHLFPPEFHCPRAPPAGPRLPQFSEHLSPPSPREGAEERGEPRAQHPEVGGWAAVPVGGQVQLLRSAGDA